MKKLLSYLLVIALVLVQFSPLAVSARDKVEKDDQTTSGSVQAGTRGSITITNTHEGKEYTIYKVLELESWDESKGAYTYNAGSGWETFLASEDAQEYLTYNSQTGVYTWVEGADAQEFAQLALEHAKANDIRGVETKASTGDNENVTFTDLELGYYLVDSTAGALCMLTTTHKDIQINEKNELATVEKLVQEDSTSQYGETNTADIGQVVYFQTKIDVKPGAENYELIDVMSDGLTLDATSIKVAHSTAANAEEISEDNYDIEFNKSVTYGKGTEEVTETADFTITFDNEFLAGLDEEDIYVMYSATLNTGAVVEGKGNPNETWLEYGEENETAKDTTITYTLSFEVKKVDQNNNDLTGAQFKLYLTNDEAGALKFVKSGTSYRLATETDTNTTDVLDAGTIEIIGLDEDAYYLEEVKAPDGYNKLTDHIDVVLSMETDNNVATTTVANNGTVSDEESINVQYETDTVSDIVIIKNFNGSLLPSTGGMGTVLFITVGSIMVLGFGVLLVTKLRLSKMSI